MKRRQFIKWGLLLGGGATCYSYARFVAARSIEVKHVSIKISRERLRAPLKILQLSDFHFSPVNPPDYLRYAIELGKAQSPDVICLTGDFITAGSSFRSADYLKILKESFAGWRTVIACLGNHDGGAWSEQFGGFPNAQEVTRLLESAGIQVLVNDSRIIEARGQKLSLVGLADLWSENTDVRKAFSLLSESEEPRVVLAHNSDSKSFVAKEAWDLMLSGHTHGGQIVIPGVGPIFVPLEDKRFIAGLNYWNDRPIYTSCGVGSLFGVRFNCKPDVSLITLLPEDVRG